MKTTRRDALAHGGRIIATAAALPFLPSVNIAHAEDDAGLFAQFEKCCQLDRAYVDATEKADLACFAVKQQFPEPPNGETRPGGWMSPGSPEHEAVLSHASEINSMIGRRAKEFEAEDALAEAAKQQRETDKSEAEKRAGVPALYKKARAAEDSMKEASAAFYYTPALTAAGMILKIKYAWSDGEVREFRAQAKDEAEFYDFDDHVMGSLLLDLERLDGRRI